MHFAEDILNRLGYSKSVELKEPVDAKGVPLPWYTYPAIEYLTRLDFSKFIVFEYGSGNSTLWWAARAKKVFSVEDNEAWYNKISSKLASNIEYVYESNAKKYVHNIDKLATIKGPKVIIIDGKFRHECANYVAEEGYIHNITILDNSDWYPEAAKTLRDYYTIEVDFSGFGPQNKYTWTTSIFFGSSAEVVYLSGDQPSWGVGALRQRNSSKQC